MSQIVGNHIANMEQNAPMISALWYPKVNFLFASRCAIYRQMILMPKPSTSEAICTASDIIAIELAK